MFNFPQDFNDREPRNANGRPQPRNIQPLLPYPIETPTGITGSFQLNDGGGGFTSSGFHFENSLCFNTSLSNNSLLCSTGFNNFGVGINSLRYNTTGNNNIGIGLRSMDYNTGGSNNTALGRFSLRYNTTGNNNVGIGRSALLCNTTGCYNIGIGYNANEFLNLLTNELNDILDAINIGIEYTKDYCYEHDKLNCDCK